MSRSDPPGVAAVETAVPPDRPAERCPHCGRPFPTERLRALHVGVAHPASCTEAERDAYEAAVTDEDDDLFVYHLKVVAAVTVLFFAFAYAYVFVWAG